MSAIVLLVPLCPNLHGLKVAMMLMGACHVIKDSTASAVMADLASSDSIGAFFGWQHFVKGLAGVIGYMLTGWLSSFSIELPYMVTSFCDLFAFVT